jgi:hypothetical protein
VKKTLLVIAFAIVIGACLGLMQRGHPVPAGYPALGALLVGLFIWALAKPRQFGIAFYRACCIIAGLVVVAGTVDAFWFDPALTKIWPIVLGYSCLLALIVYGIGYALRFILRGSKKAPTETSH